MTYKGPGEWLAQVKKVHGNKPQVETEPKPAKQSRSLTPLARRRQQKETNV